MAPEVLFETVTARFLLVWMIITDPILIIIYYYHYYYLPSNVCE